MPRIGICTWSLRPESAGDLVNKVRAVGVKWVQLHLDPVRAGDARYAGAVEALREAGIGIASGMMSMVGEDYSTLDSIRRTGGVRPDEHWAANHVFARGNAELARSLGIDLVTFHAGFIPDDSAAPSDPVMAVMIERIRAIVDAFCVDGVRVGFETGQESAASLEAALGRIDRPTAGVNFDPANMILYGMGDPVAALERLAPRVVQVHIKDALPTKTPGTWGTEVPVGAGAVDWKAFFRVMRAKGITCDLMIEREAGGQRAEECARAREMVEKRHEGT